MAESRLDTIQEMEAKLEELRRKFDMFFQGSKEQRVPPSMQKEAYAGTLRRLREEAVRWNTAERFRLNTLHQRLVSYDRMWQRTITQIEDGTYKRDKMKVAMAKKRDAEDAAVGDTVRSADGLPDVSQKSVPAEVPLGGAPPGPRRPQPNGGGDDMLSENRMRQLYGVYMQAKKRTGESSSLTYEALVQQLHKQVPAIKAKHKCESVEFKVVLKDGKAMLKAIPK
jgi:hypothetical protein